MTHGMRTWLAVITALSALWAGGCAAAQTAMAGPPDQPVPASEARAQLSARVDLEPGGNCEETFDLAMYQNRAIDLIEWDERKGECTDRKVGIRYLSAKTSEGAVVQAARSLTRRFALEKQGDRR